MKINMKNNTKIVLILLFFLMFCTAQGLHAQDPFDGTPLDFGTDVNDAGTAPINGLVGIALVIGAYFGARKLKQKGK